MPRHTLVIFCCFALIIPETVLQAQENARLEEEAGTDSAASIFPLHIPLQTVADGRIEWRPDWPAGMPVDAFDVLNGDIPGSVSSVTLSGGGLNLSVTLNDSGALILFPVVLNGRFYQFGASYDRTGRISGFTVETGSENPVKIEFLAYENEDGQPSLARINSAGGWFFASLLYQNGLTVETWYDVDGNALAVFTTRYANGLPRSHKAVIRNVTEEAGKMTGGAADKPANTGGEESAANAVLSFDSMGNATRIDSGDGVFEAVYNGAGPRYWKRPDSVRFALQRDAEGRVIRMTGEAEDESPLDYRYEYDVDGRGSWVERREFRMTAKLDALIPVAGDSFRRSIEYR